MSSNKPNCDCVSKVNESLAERGLSLDVVFSFPDMHATPRMTATNEKNRVGRQRKESVSITPSYCPFCGVKYGVMEKEGVAGV